MKNQTTIQLIVNVTVQHYENECSADEIAAATQSHLQQVLNAENDNFTVLEVGEVIVPVYELSVNVLGVLPTAYDYSNHILSLIE